MNMFSVLRGVQPLRYLHLYAIIFFGCLHFVAYGQGHRGNMLDQKISVQFHQISIEEGLKLIGKKAGCTFVYSNVLLATDRKVSISYHNKALGELLQDLLADYALALQVEGNQVFIKAKTHGDLTVSGKVLAEDAQVLPFASIRVLGLNIGANTDQEGFYKIEHLKKGKYTLLVSCLGYLSEQFDLELKENKSLVFDVRLKADKQLLNEVTVTGKTDVQRVRESSYHVTSIDAKQFANTTADVNQVLNRTSGVRIREQGGLGSDFTFSVNGLSGNHIKFFIDSIPMEAYGSGLSMNNIPINLADRIEVYKGVVPAQLGSDALGGAVNLITKRNAGKSLDASYSVGSFNTHRAALSTSYTSPNTGITFNFNSYYNYSDNNYYMRNNPEANVLLQVIEDNRFVTKDKLRRFHDAYRSYMGQLEVGIAQKSWADLFVLGLTYTNVFNERQTGATQEKVIGELFSNSHNLIPSVRYRKKDFLIKGLSASLFGNFSRDVHVITDTSSRTWYQWNGIPDRINQTSGELNTEKSITHFTSYNTFVQANLNYRLAQQHTLNLNYNLNTSHREGYNEIDPYNNSFDRTNSLNKSILGLTYQQEFLDGRLMNTFFAKYFGIGGEVQTADGIRSSEHSSYFGYGIASRYKLLDQLGIKASYEHAYRLPNLIELYGNGEEIKGNPNLKPENSNNFNLGLFYSTRFNKHGIWIEAAGFYRDAKDYIIATPMTGGDEGAFSSSYNAGGIKVNGFEGEIRYDYNQLFNVWFNLSYQNAVDREQYVTGTSRPKITYNSRVPNQPWLFGNLDISAGKNNLIGNATRLQFNWFLQFINDYSLSWSKLGDENTKDYIPKQWIQNASVTYSMHSGKYNLTLEGRNITDEIAYDNFKLQKPGRSFNLKFRYFINQ